MKGRKRKCMASNIVRCKGLPKKPRAQEDRTHAFDDHWTDSNPEISKVTNTSASKVVKNEEVEALRESHDDVFGTHGRTFDDDCTDPGLEISKTTKTSVAREWSNASTGSVKEIKRIRPKISRPSKNTVKTIVPPLQRKQTVSKKRHANQTCTGSFQFKNQPCIYYGPEIIEVLESVETQQTEETLKNISNNTENLNRNATLSDSAKDTRQILKNQRTYTAKSDMEDYPLIHRNKYLTSKNDQGTAVLTPKKRPLTQSQVGFSEVRLSVQKIKKRKLKNSDYDSVSSSEVSRSVADVSKSRRHSSVATLPARESPQMKVTLSNVNKNFNTSAKRLTPKKEALYAKIAKQVLIKKNSGIVDYSSDSSSEKSPSDEEVSGESDSDLERQAEELQEFKNIMQSNLDFNRNLLSSDFIEEKSPCLQKLQCKKSLY
ncbi:hypothetical protein TNCT_483211 [Trichonephila clavata]|uniref:Uncharacterized protein n=1 Tax=Trichonephila clavata TaxID=2740835 RepID=A0A8X6H4T0_TRICU|nr:hypothetical protein TNCT_483211 [Trichonephila clavata]